MGNGYVGWSCAYLQQSFMFLLMTLPKVFFETWEGFETRGPSLPLISGTQANVISCYQNIGSHPTEIWNFHFDLHSAWISLNKGRIHQIKLLYKSREIPHRWRQLIAVPLFKMITHNIKIPAQASGLFLDPSDRTYLVPHLPSLSHSKGHKYERTPTISKKTRENKLPPLNPDVPELSNLTSPRSLLLFP